MRSRALPPVAASLAAARVLSPGPRASVRPRFRSPLPSPLPAPQLLRPGGDGAARSASPLSSFLSLLSSPPFLRFAPPARALVFVPLAFLSRRVSWLWSRVFAFETSSGRETRVESGREQFSTRRWRRTRRAGRAASVRRGRGGGSLASAVEGAVSGRGERRPRLLGVTRSKGSGVGRGGGCSRGKRRRGQRRRWGRAEDATGAADGRVGMRRTSPWLEERCEGKNLLEGGSKGWSAKGSAQSAGSQSAGHGKPVVQSAGRRGARAQSAGRRGPGAQRRGAQGAGAESGEQIHADLGWESRSASKTEERSTISRVPGGRARARGPYPPPNHDLTGSSSSGARNESDCHVRETCE